jgi:hypothetical protein
MFMHLLLHQSSSEEHPEAIEVVVGWIVEVDIMEVGETTLVELPIEVVAEEDLQIPPEHTAPAGHSASQSHLSPMLQHAIACEHNPQLVPEQAWFLQSLKKPSQYWPSPQ